VTISAEEIQGVVSAAWPQVQVIGSPEPLTGGFWAQMWRLRVSGQPEGVPGDLVLRFAPHPEMGAKEAEVQRAVAAQGYPTPTVHLSRHADSPVVGWWSLMDFAPGASLLAGLDGAGLLRRAPSLVRTMPAQLAETMAALHRVDPTPITDAVRRAAPGVAWTADEVFEQLCLGAGTTKRHDVAAALGHLAGRAPSLSAPVICHGDLHPFNVLADGDVLTVLDWTGAVLADPCFDLALTELLLANPPLDLPRPLAALARRAGKLLARRFVARYSAANPHASLNALDWYRALHSARVLIDVTQLRAEHGPEARGHPWRLIAPAAASNLSTATGVEVRSDPGPLA
jgi:aminoglycoside phosphotransferase (APT) family kinase protein